MDSVGAWDSQTVKKTSKAGSRLTVVFTGGGTGGHVYPGIAVMEALARRLSGRGDVRFAWIGGKSGIEGSIVRRSGVSFHGIHGGKLRRYVSIRNFVDVLWICAGFFESLVVLRKLRPQVVFSKGGYVTVPPVAAARLLRVPVLSHESDSDPGLATRLNTRSSQVMFLSFDETVKFFNKRKGLRVEVVGTPVRAAFTGAASDDGRRYVGAPDGAPVLLVLGGSQGARQINELVRAALPVLTRDWYVVHQAGPGNRIASDAARYRCYEYIHDEFPEVLAAADLVVARAGATTIFEVAAAGKPAVLIPLGMHASRGDQIRNAELMERRGAAAVLIEPSAQLLAEILQGLRRRPEELRRMGERARTLHRQDAADRIAAGLAEYLNCNGGENA